MNNTNDFVESYDDSNNNLPTTTDTPSINWFGLLMVAGFLIVIGSILYKNFFNEQLNRDAILLRQVELLNVLKTNNNEETVQQVVNEYDSLARILEAIDNG